MSFIALATRRYAEVVDFYGTALSFPVVRSWDRPRGRGCVFDLGGLTLEILDALREQAPQQLGEPGERVNVVVEVDDLDAVRARLPMGTPDPITTSWGARLFSLRDPDGIPVWFLQWIEAVDGNDSASSA